ncbi:MAG: hypothetical protein EBT06_14500 [Gammaproteobacteria bacterium]|nr:hypothetical protein [Gammaproteobacteria bacterium]NBY23297.1 hypothetical protein [Gammaproteobacteria bacterium]
MKWMINVTLWMAVSSPLWAQDWDAQTTRTNTAVTDADFRQHLIVASRRPLSRPFLANPMVSMFS